MSEVPALSCEGLAKTFHQGADRIELLQDVDLSVAPGEAVAVIGASGSGKSTLLHLLAGLERPTAGQASIGGRPLKRLRARALDRLRNRQLGFVFQFHFLLPEFSALENVAMPLLVCGVSPTESGRLARRSLEHLGLAHRLHHRPGQLSGGECQRVAIARALVHGPACVMADEPTGNLDAFSTARVFDHLLTQVRQGGAALLMVTHDRSLAARLDRALELRGGRLSPVSP